MRAQLERNLEEDPYQRQEDGVAEEAVGENVVDATRQLHAVRPGKRQRFLKRALDVAASALRDHLLGIGAGRHFDVPDGPCDSFAQSRRCVGRRAATLGRHLEDLSVALEHLDGRPPKRVAVRGDAVLLEQIYQLDKNIVDVRPVGDGDVAVVFFPVFHQVNRRIKERLDPLAPMADRRDDGSAQKHVYSLEVEFGLGVQELVPHVEVDDEVDVEFHELNGEIEVSGQVPCVDHVDDDVGLVLNEVAAYDPFLHGIGREAVRARQVNNLDVVAPVLEVADLLLNSDTRPVSHLLPGARHAVEYGGLPRVGVAREGYRERFLVRHALPRPSPLPRRLPRPTSSCLRQNGGGVTC